MKKIFTLGFLFVLLSFSTASAQLLIEENFDNGSIDSVNVTGLNSNWSRHSGSQGPGYSSAGLEYTGHSGSGVGGAVSFTNGGSGVNDGDINRIAADSVTTTAYASFLVNLTSGRTGDYFFHLGPRTMGTLFRARVFAMDNGAAGWKIGLSKSSSGTVYSDSALEYNKTYFVVVKYTFNAGADDDLVQLFVYEGTLPSSESSESVASVGPLGAGLSGDITDVGAVAIRQGSNTPTGKIDAITLSDSWPVINSNPLITIAQAIEDLNMDFIPDRLDDTVKVGGVIISPNYQIVNNDYYMYDGTAGTNLFMFGPSVFNLNLGDSVVVTAKVAQYNGKSEVIPLDSASWTIVSSGNTVPEAEIISIAEFKANPEAYEGKLIGFTNLTRSSGNWPSSILTNSGVNLYYTDGSDSVQVRIDTDMDIDGNPEPSGPVDIIGIATQFDNSAPYSGGYQVMPRYFATDILPGGTVPVELASFSATSNGSNVRLSWSTASETNNSGFEVQRKITGGSFEAIAFVEGNGTTTEKQIYSYTDSKVSNGKYSYRLKQVDFDGSFSYSSESDVVVNIPSEFSLSQNYPNPFNPSTSIKFSLAVDSKVSMKIFNVLGQEITTLINSSYAAGQHEIKFNASKINSGLYFYKLEASGIDGSAYSAVKKMMLTK